MAVRPSQGRRANAVDGVVAMTTSDERRAEHPVVLVGRLEQHGTGHCEFRVRDDVGNEFTIPEVRDGQSVMHLTGSYVSVSGRPERDAAGRVTGLREAHIELAANPFAGSGIPAAISLEDMMSSVPGPIPGGIPDLNDDEIEAFHDALRGWREG